MTPTPTLEHHLQHTFRLPGFRPYQEAVCRAAVAGRDVLVVMPTGAGKSLCYQLPGLTRGGTTLVISPLIALMEDQVAKLRELGLRAERIHSGRDRLESRQVCRDYAAGLLDYLFIAPERLAVTGFPEFLAKTKPVLVAIDEAHCISHWGHDFRPEYRLLGQRLPMLRPAPVMALTATATPRVQDDIATQLGLSQPERFIHGFRRTNIAVEVAEQTPSERTATVLRLVGEAANRPAIVYARTRKEAEELAGKLAETVSAAAYHAGLGGATREQVQTAFLAGDLEAVVATIAFGMGIDKPNVRTVLHAGIPSTLEAYYQEIGRAGRDGLPSRAVLLYSWADRRNHEYFHNLNYPASDVLEAIVRKLGPVPQSAEELARALSLEPDVVDKALEKLWLHGGAMVDPDGNFTKGTGAWRAPYQTQRDHRSLQLELVFRFADSHDCRMLHLVRHFGDQEDSGEPCGQCDVCAPAACRVHRYRAPSPTEERRLGEILGALVLKNGQTVGQLHRQLGGDAGELDRKILDRLLGGLVRAELVRLEADEFEKDGKVIPFQRAFLTRDGHRLGPAAAAEVLLPEEAEPTKKGAKAKVVKLKPSVTAASDALDAEAAPDEALVAALKDWRLAQARRRRVPAFHILSNRTLLAIAAERPRDEDELLAIRGMGPTLVKKLGEDLLKIVRGAG
ncbi:MAG: ATP-dependent DNA helicase RecQ [Thermoanaerobaculia bacterium]|nr:ATP-dependent DNA helicase RecQ [Thermoanaerobaculia bacterium]